MDFIKIKSKTNKNELLVYPDFNCVIESTDLVTKGRNFYAIWNKKKGLWSLREKDLYQLVDEYIKEEANKRYPDISKNIMCFDSVDGGIPEKYKKFLKYLPDNLKDFDTKINFANSIIKKEDYSTKKLSYSLEPGNIDAYDELMSILYDKDERKKLEWAVGSIIEGDSKDIQKFIVLYGSSGSGKSTFLNIIQKMFPEYYVLFEAKALVGNNTFATEMLRSNPLIAIQHDGDLSKIEDNSKLNSIISHEEIILNEKYKQSYSSRMNCFLFMGTNKPVKITDTKSGLLRRLINVSPTGQKIEKSKYVILMKKIEKELGAIAYHCHQIYLKYGKNYYDDYVPTAMMGETNILYNVVEENFSLFKDQNGTTLSQAYELYKQYCEESKLNYIMPKFVFKEELKDFFEKFSELTEFNSKSARNVYKKFKTYKFVINSKISDKPKNIQLELNLNKSLLDELYSDCLAQYGNAEEIPIQKWSNVTSTLKNLNTKKLHYVQFPENHIVIDFDLKDESGEKNAELNLQAAAEWPRTYAEFSKSGKGVHLHYNYNGDINELSKLVEKDIEIKTFIGNSSLRRKLTFCNNEEVAIFTGGLPKKEKKMITENQIKSEYGLRKLIERNLNKEIHSATKPSIDFIFKILEDAYNGNIKYDLNDMRTKVLAFAMNSTNNSEYCVKLINQMKFCSKEINQSNDISDGEIVFYDVEVFPNLFIIVYKSMGDDKQAIKLINPTSVEIEQLFKFKLIGFNCRRYDNHILYARYLGYTNEQLFQLSQKIINDHGGLFGEAYNISYTDVYDFCNIKQSLKKWEIELGIHHMELGYKWDEPVPEDKWEEVANYCINDVIATEKVFNNRKADWLARQALASIANGSVNDTTNTLATKIIFGNEKHPQLVYTDLSETFPGYELKNQTDDNGKHHIINMYRDTDIGFGGYVYAKHGVYYNVALLDVASMHPTSLILLNYFGDYTSKFADILNARLAIKHNRYDEARELMNGKLAPFLEDESQTEALAYALKIVINSQYGLSSSKFDVPQRDIRNVNNIVALRGALFMKTLQDEITDQGYEVIHIKTDSIKIANADKKIIDFCFEFAQKYGYTFEHEATYEKICLITDADYIAKYLWSPKEKNIGQWTATGAQFAHPYIFKTLFSRENIIFDDLCETKAVKTALYLDMNEELKDGEHDYKFIGKIGRFLPIKEGMGGGLLVAERNDKYNAVSGTKGYRWLEANTIKELNKQDDIYMDYYYKLTDSIFSRINEYTNAELFCSNNLISKEDNERYDDGPKIMDCGNINCDGCINLLINGPYHSDCKDAIDNTNYILEKE